MDETLVIPDDLAACQALLVRFAQTIGEQNEKTTGLEQQVQEQKLTISELMQRAFRSRSRRAQASQATAREAAKRAVARARAAL